MDETIDTIVASLPKKYESKKILGIKESAWSKRDAWFRFADLLEVSQFSDYMPIALRCYVKAGIVG